MVQFDSLVFTCFLFSGGNFALSFTPTSSQNNKIVSSSRLFADPAGKGFGSNANANTNTKSPGPDVKSYGKKELSPIKDLIDEESGMREFFVTSHEEWQPLFRSLTKNGTDQSVPALSFINNNDSGNKNHDNDTIFEFNENTSPWKILDALPTEPTEISILSDFLDAMQTSLIEDIPVDETTKDDENDLRFIEEGRRMLVCTRFHVVQEIETNSINSLDKLFAICWSEVTELREKDEADTGSLIVVKSPDIRYDDLRRFVDMNLQRPLKWLGQHNNFEVVALEKGGLGVIRIIHKISDIPTELPNNSDR
jgi:hypothetical protein